MYSQGSENYNPSARNVIRLHSVVEADLTIKKKVGGNYFILVSLLFLYKKLIKSNQGGKCILYIQKRQEKVCDENEDFFYVVEFLMFSSFFTFIISH